LISAPGGKAHRLSDFIKEIHKEQIRGVEDKQFLDFRFHSSIPLSLCFVFWRFALSCFAAFLKDANALRIEGFCSRESFFAENSLNASVITSISLPRKETR